MKKVVTLLLCAVLLVSLLAVSAFAAEPNKFTIEADLAEVKAGDVVKFTVSAVSTEACDSFGLIMDFDRDVFETVNVVCNAELLDEYEESLIATKAAQKAAGKEGFAVSFYESQVYSGKVGILTLKVKEGAQFETTTITARASALKGDGQVAFEVVPVEIAMVHEHSWVEYQAVEPTCDTEGNIAYKQCSGCGEAWTLEAEPKPLSKFGWVLGALGHTWVDHAAVAPTCTSDGNIAYQQCSVCGAAQTAGENPMPLSKFGWVLAAQHTALKQYEAVAATCDTDGHEAYGYCEDCQVFVYEDPLKLSYQDGVIPATGHDVAHVEALAPACHSLGNVEYWYCVDCGYAWEDEAMTKVSNLKRVILPALGNEEMVHFEAVEPACHSLGNIEYWYCPECEGYFQDEACTQVTNAKRVILPELGSEKLVHVAAKAATTEAEGNIEYWYCPECEAYFQDEACTQLTNAKRVITPKLEAEVEETKPVEKPAEKPEADNDKTGDATPVFALVALVAMSVFGLALVVVNKKQFAA